MTYMPGKRPDDRAGGLGADPIGPNPTRVPPKSTPRTKRAPAGTGYDSTLAAMLAAYPKPETSAQLQADAQSQISPLVQAITDSITARAKAGAGAISGYTGQLAKDLGGYADSAKNIYGAAQTAQSASDAALADRLQGGGQQLASDLSSRLAGIGNGTDPAVAQAAAAIGQTGQGSGNALYGKGSASLSDLISRGAGAQEYAGKLPGIAKLAGAQDLRDLEMSSQHDLAAQTADVRSQIPALVASLKAANDQKATNLAGAQTDLFKYQTGRQDAKDSAAAQSRERAVLAKMANETSAAKAQQDWQKFQISEQDRNARAAAADTNRNLRTQAQIDAANGRSQAQIAAANKRAAAKAAADAKKAATKGTTATPAVSEKASNDADLFYYGKQPQQHAVQTTDPSTGKTTVRWVDVPGTGTPGLDYADAVKRLMAKYPTLGKQGAMNVLNNYYAPGERGRPVPASQSKDPAVNPNAAGPPAP